MKQYPAELRTEIRRVILQEKISLSEAALRFDIPAGTLSSWKRQDEQQGLSWSPSPPTSPPPPKPFLPSGSIHRQHLISGLIEEYLTLHIEAMDALKKEVSDPMKRVEALSRLSQALDRTLRALDKSSPELSRLAIAKEFLEKQAQFVQEHFPQHLKPFLEILEPFAMEISHNLSNH